MNASPITQREKMQLVLNEFTNLLSKERLRISKSIDDSDLDSYAIELALLELLLTYIDKLPDLDQKEWPYCFHKNFRIGCIDAGSIDNAIWHLLDRSKLFWESIDNVEEKLEQSVSYDI